MAAGDAQRLLNDETLNQAFDLVRQTAFEAAMRCAPTDDIGRHRYLLAAQVVEQTKAYLAAIISAENHELAQAQAREITNYYELKAQRFRPSSAPGADDHLDRVVNGSRA
jgi:hypothetical protein